MKVFVARATSPKSRGRAVGSPYHLAGFFRKIAWRQAVLATRRHLIHQQSIPLMNRRPSTTQILAPCQRGIGSKEKGLNMKRVILATPDEDLGLCLLQEATERARELAQEFGCPITVRDPITDRVYKTVRAA